MRRFEMHRVTDLTGVSGTGVVAEGVEFTDGTTVIRWRGEAASTVVWSYLIDAIDVHGHNGATEFRYLDEDTPPLWTDDATGEESTGG